MSTPNFGGLPVVTFEARRATEMGSLIERHGGVPILAPALREVRSPPTPETFAFARDLAAGAFDLVILLTGVGTRALAEEVASELPKEQLLEALRRVRVVVRGPKPAAVLREWGVPGFVLVPSPNTHRELLTTLDTTFGASLSGMRVAVQEYGAPNELLYEGLRARGMTITRVLVYTWALPEDTAPLRRGLRALASGESRIALFTTRAQVENALLVAAEEGIESEVRAALKRGVVASIGPVCSETLRAEHLPPDLTPEHPKMGHLVRESAEKATAILAAKDH
ncbi:MAG: uroporphyrinogen-III synthase [Polyangiaceae bacterium]